MEAASASAWGFSEGRGGGGGGGFQDGKDARFQGDEYLFEMNCGEWKGLLRCLLAGEGRQHGMDWEEERWWKWEWKWLLWWWWWMADGGILESPKAKVRAGNWLRGFPGGSAGWARHYSTCDRYICHRLTSHLGSPRHCPTRKIAGVPKNSRKNHSSNESNFETVDGVEKITDDRNAQKFRSRHGSPPTPSCAIEGKEQVTEQVQKPARPASHRPSPGQMSLLVQTKSQVQSGRVCALLWHTQGGPVLDECGNGWCSCGLEYLLKVTRRLLP